jgi:hypothetical protein
MDKYESNPDRNAYTDAEKSKLAGIQDGAQVNAPLYGATGQNTNGAMTQKATTEALALKADILNVYDKSTSDSNYQPKITATGNTNILLAPTSAGGQPVARAISDMLIKQGKKYPGITPDGNNLVISDPLFSSNVSDWYEGMEITVSSDTNIASGLGIDFNGIGRWIYDAVSGGARIQALNAGQELKIYYSQIAQNWILSDFGSDEKAKLDFEDEQQVGSLTGLDVTKNLVTLTTSANQTLTINSVTVQNKAFIIEVTATAAITVALPASSGNCINMPDKASISIASGKTSIIHVYKNSRSGKWVINVEEGA